MTTCRVCKSENIKTAAESEVITYKNGNLNVLFDYSQCAECGEEFIDTHQIDANELRVREAKREADGLLSAQEILAARQELGLTQEEAAKVFGGGVNAFSKYERGEVIQSVAMDKLIRVALHDRNLFDVYLLPLAGFEPPANTSVQILGAILTEGWAYLSAPELVTTVNKPILTTTDEQKNRDVAHWKNDSLDKRVA